MGRIARTAAVTAGNADEAVAALNAQHCDLAIIDMMMPGKNGLWLAEELLRNHPEMAVVLSTGNAAMIDNTPPRIADFLIKPYSRERFVLAVDRGREWRRQAVEEIERQAQLQAKCRRGWQTSRPKWAWRARRSQRIRRAVSDRRRPDSGRHGAQRTRRTLHRFDCARAGRRRGRPISSSTRRAFTTSASWRCPKRC